MYPYDTHTSNYPYIIFICECNLVKCFNFLLIKVAPPFVPECPAGDGDTSNFIECDEEKLEQSETEQFAELFKDF